MRVEHIRTFVPIPAVIWLFWDRITLSRTTIFYFVLSVIHCVIQVIFQVQAFRINAQAVDFLASIADQGNAVDPDAFYVQDNDLRLCDSVPASFSTSSCQVIWDSSFVGNNTVVTESSSNSTILTTHTPITSTVIPSTVMSTVATTSEMGQRNERMPSTNAISLVPTASPVPELSNKTDEHLEHLIDERALVEGLFQRNSLGGIQTVEINGTVQVVVSGMGWNNSTAILDRQCLWALGWPVQTLRETKREDLTFIAFQIWVLGMSVVALLNESVPHTFASLLTHMVATGWAGFQIFNTAQFRNEFARVITNGACHPISLLPSYWQSRAAAEIPSLVLNAVALLVSTYLSWRLVKLFGWQTFKRVGASLTISRIYKIILTLSIVIQLSLFFVATSIALWLDQLWNGAIGHLATSPVYKALFIITLILLIPWLALGWFAVRRELNVPMMIFLVMCLGYLGEWAALFGSTAFRWTYMTWTFFGVITSASVFLTFTSFVLGIICRINFGRGLVRYLNSGHELEPMNYADDLEKVAFPTNDKAVPTFSTTFGSGLEVPPPSRWFGNWQRSTNSGASRGTLQFPSSVLTRPLSSHTCGSLESHKSRSSFVSIDGPGSNGKDVKRWVIE